MANVLHSQLTGSDLHEIKGASGAASGTIPISNGAGQTPFGFYSYNSLTDQPTIPPKITIAAQPTITPKMSILVLNNVTGTFTADISALGFTTIFSVAAQPVPVTPGANTPVTWATVGSVSNRSVNMSILQWVSTTGGVGSGPLTSPATEPQTVYLTVVGI